MGLSPAEIIEEEDRETEEEKFLKRWPSILESKYSFLVLPPECKRMEKPKRQLEIGKEITSEAATVIGAQGVDTDNTIGRVSVVGAGMASNPGVAATIFETLSNNSINIGMISTSAIRVSCVVAREDVERATEALHKAFELDKG